MRKMQLFLLLLFFSVLSAQPYLWQENGIPLANEKDFQYSGYSAQSDDGSTITCWTEITNSSMDVWAMRFDEYGDEMWPEPQMIFDTDLPLRGPRLDCTCDGNMIVSAYYGDYNSDTIMLNKIDLNGIPLWTEPLALQCALVNTIMNYTIVPDQEGGIYLIIGSLDYPDASYNLFRIGSNGELLWDSESIELFNSDPDLAYGISACSDCQGGVIACGYLGDDHNLIGQRILPDGSMPWGENGIVEIMELGENAGIEIIPAGTDQFALLKSKLYGYGFDLYRMDIDGNLLPIEPAHIGQSYSYFGANDFISDASGNVYIGWSSSFKDYDNVNAQKIDSANQLCWDNQLHSCGIRCSIARMTLQLGIDGSLYQSWAEYTYALDNYSLRLQKYNMNGNALWGDHGVVVAEGCGNMSWPCHVISNNNNLLLWSDTSDVNYAFNRQMFLSNGIALFDDESITYYSGIDDVMSSMTFAEREDTATDNLFFTWYSSEKDVFYMQSIDSNGEISAQPYEKPLLKELNLIDPVLDIFPIQDDFIIFWINEIDGQYQLLANRFNANCSRIWSNDIVLDQGTSSEITPIRNLSTQLYQGVIEVGWDFDDGEQSRIKFQKIIDGELFWQEPITIGGAITEHPLLVAIEDDYILWAENGFRALRLAQDGSPCEGWDIKGHLVTRVIGLNTFWNVINTEDGLVLVWLMYENGDKSIRLQVVGRDGSMRWFDGDPLVTTSNIFTPMLEINGKNLYVFWRTFDEVYIQSFTMHGEPIWDSPLTIVKSDIRLEDVVPTPDGYLVGCSYGEEGDLMLQHVNYNGNLWENELTVCNLPGEQSELNIIRSTNRRYFLTWKDYRGDNNNAQQYIQYLDYHATGCDESDLTPIWDPGLSVSPNPFNPETSVRFSLPTNSHVVLSVYNIRGQLITTLCDEQMNAGDHRIEWDGRDRRQKAVSSGVYLLNLKIDVRNYRSKALLLK